MRWLLLPLIACSSATTPPTKPTAVASPLDAGLLPVVQVRGEDEHTPLEQRMRELHVNAVSIAVFDNYQIIWTRAYGLADVEGKQPADEHTTFLAGSISKSVNALGQLKAVAAGTLALDTPINDSLTSWKLPDNELTKATPVTLRMLLSHTGGVTVHGFRGYAPSEKVPTILETLDGKPPSNSPPIRVDLAPGTKFRYAGGGTTISQLALTEKSGKPYPVIMHELVLGPIGMTESSYDQNLDGNRLAHAAVGYDATGKVIDGKRFRYPEMAAAGLWTTPTDLARFLVEIAKARAGTSKLITKQIAEQMTTKVADVRGTDAVGLGVFLGVRNGMAWFGHGGADVGFQADVLCSLDGGRGIVIMTNSEAGMSLMPEIQRTIFARLSWPGADEVVTRVALDSAKRALLVGRYNLPEAPYEILERNGKLVGRVPFTDGAELVPIATDIAIDRGTGSSYRVTAEGLHVVQTNADVPRVTTAHPLWLWEAGKTDEAIAALQAVKDSNDEEDRINLLGYRVMRKDPVKAAQLLKLNVAAFPDSSNAQDSLGEALAASGDVAGAIAAYEKELALLGSDPRIPAEQKPALEGHAKEILVALRKR